MTELVLVVFIHLVLVQVLLLSSQLVQNLLVHKFSGSLSRIVMVLKRLDVMLLMPLVVDIVLLLLLLLVKLM
jgi:hypothetical protein